MSKKRHTGGVPKGVSQYSMTVGDFRLFVKLYVIARMLQAQFTAIKQLAPAEYFRGVIKGYEDAFLMMRLKDADVNSVMDTFDMSSVELEAKNIYKEIIEVARTPKIITSNVSHQAKAAKEVFDGYLRRFKGGKP